MCSKVAPTRRSLAPTPTLALSLYLETFALGDFNAAESVHTGHLNFWSQVQKGTSLWD